MEFSKGKSIELQIQNEKVNKKKNQFDEWIKEQEKDLFQTEKFKAIGKDDDYVFQSLAFLGNGSKELSIATTILSDLNEVPSDLKDELKNIQEQIHYLMEKLRSL